MWDPYLASMACSHVKMHSQSLTFTQLRVECIAMFGSCSKKPAKPNVAAKSTGTTANPSGEPVKPHSQNQKDKIKRKIEAQATAVEQQKNKLKS